MASAAKAIPIVDLSGDADALVRAIVAACTDTGFFGVTGHGVPKATLDGAFGAARAFFARLAGRETPPDFKAVFTVGPETSDAADAYDTCEAARPHWGASPWPARPEGFRDAVLDDQPEMQRLTGRLMAPFCRALGVPEDHLAQRSGRAPSQLRLIHYPPYDGPGLPGPLRAGEHTDLSLLTIAASDDNAVGGLEVRDRDGDWVAAPDFDGFKVNIGDTMMRWCNDRWVSRPHRAANPPPEAGARSDRLSLADFHIVDYDAAIECLPSCVDAVHPPARYAPITIGEYRASRFARTANAGG